MMDTFFEGDAISCAKVSGTVSKLLEAMATQFHCQLSSSEEMQYIVTLYDSHHIPDIRLSDYLYRIATMAKCSPRDMVVALVYIDKLINNGVISGISYHNVHRLMAVALMVASKFYEDLPYSNRSWAKIVGMPLRELNSAESNLLSSLNYELDIKLETIQMWAGSISQFADENPVQEREEDTQHRDQDSSEPINQETQESNDSPIAL